MLLYVLYAILASLLLLFIGQYRLLRGMRKKEKAVESTLATLQQWVVSNDKSVLQHLSRLNELADTLYVRVRMIDLTMRNKINGEKQILGHELGELEAMLAKEPWPGAFINEHTHKDAVEKIRSEDIHLYYGTLIEELRHLNRQIGRAPARSEIIIGAANTPAARSEAPVNGWYNRVNKVV